MRWTGSRVRDAARYAGLAAAGVVLAFSGPGGLAQAKANSAEQFARTIDAHYNVLRSLQVNFSESYDGMGLHREEHGTLLLARGGALHSGRMRWTYAAPAGKLFVFDGRDAYFYTPGQSEVPRVPGKQLGAEDDPRSPMALLLGHAQLAKQLAGLTLSPAPGGEQTLAGVPRGLEQRIARLAVTATTEGVIHELRFEEIDGSRTDFHFEGERENVPAPAGAFVFAPPAGAHVVDGIAPM